VGDGVEVHFGVLCAEGGELAEGLLCDWWGS
jgi:hypothetical protein